MSAVRYHSNRIVRGLRLHANHHHHGKVSGIVFQLPATATQNEVFCSYNWGSHWIVAGVWRWCTRCASDACAVKTIQNACDCCRCLTLMYPLRFGRMRIKTARLIVACGWMTAIVLSLLPLSKGSIFGDAYYGRTGLWHEYDTNITRVAIIQIYTTKAATKPENWYRDPGTLVSVSVSVSMVSIAALYTTLSNSFILDIVTSCVTGVCLPFVVSNQRLPGWEYSVFIFLVLNLISFIVIAVG